jgi:threonine synthase
VPSGNFGNLTAGLYAYKMGAPIKSFIAATNINKTVPDFLENGNYATRESKATISNAMDVGSPSNFERMAAHFTWEQMRALMSGVSVTDEETRQTISKVFGMGYCLDPHTAVGWKAADKLMEKGLLKKPEPIAIAATAHPAKFAEVLEPLIGHVALPAALQNVMERKVQSRTIPADYSVLRELL